MELPFNATCLQNTGGTCSVLSCDSSRGPTTCESGTCMCQPGFCAVDGKCSKPAPVLLGVNAGTWTDEVMATVGSQEDRVVNFSTAIFVACMAVPLAVALAAGILLRRKFPRPNEADAYA